ncbi:MAG TPA: hypothetical protein VKF36_14495 [Syntrophorhabdales bacterium]|nr:hypothetical protein [Syntrophorhabdales bacterium]
MERAADEPFPAFSDYDVDDVYIDYIEGLTEKWQIIAKKLQKMALTRKVHMGDFIQFERDGASGFDKNDI